jgi:V-type H+-transporting ATPase subunit E
VQKLRKRCAHRYPPVSCSITSILTKWPAPLSSRDSHQSTLTNKSRLRLLHRREEHLQDLFALARAQIARLAGDEARYVQFLEGVIAQGLLQLLEPSATVYARAKDAAIAARALDGAKKTYYDISGRQVELELDASLGDELYVGTSIVDSGSS